MPPLAHRWDARAAPLLLPAAVFTLGLVLARTELVPPVPAALLGAGAAAFLLLARRRGLALALALGAALGLADLMLDARAACAPDAWEGMLRFQARVLDVESRPNGAMLMLEDARKSNGERIAGRLRLYGRHLPAAVVPGAGVEVVARLSRPEADRNPGAFDYPSWCFDRRIARTGSVRNIRVIAAAEPSAIERARARVRAAIDRAEPRVKGVLEALVLGRQGMIDREVRAAFAAGGASHLLAISGLHFGMVAGFGFLLAWIVLTARLAWIVALPVRRLALAAGLMLAAGYGTLAGWPLPAMRSGAMLAAGVIAWWCRARIHPMQTLAIAALMVLVCDPSAVASLSLWLSFAATAALLVWAGRPRTAASPSRRIWAALKGLLAVSSVAFLATLPWVAASFGRLPLYAVPANALLVPLYGFWVLPAALAGAVLAILGLDSLAGAAMHAAGAGVRAGLVLLESMRSWPMGDLHVVKLPFVAHLAFGALLACVGLFWLRGRTRPALLALGIALSAYAGLLLHERRPAAPLWAVWDVGQGAASMLALPDGTVIAVDAPGRRTQRFTGGNRAAEAMRAVGLLHADVVVVSHAQSDHMGGVADLIEGLNRVGALLLPDVPAMRRHPGLSRLRKLALRRGARILWTAAGQRFRWGGVRARVLWPPRGLSGGDPNATSLVLSVRLPDGRGLLWPGDIERGTERKLAPRIEPVQAMLAPHHGSRTSSSEALLVRARPALVVIQRGRRNRYGFPHPEVLARYQKHGARVLDTADGAVLVRWEKDGMKLRRGTPPVSPRRAAALQWWEAHL